MNKNRKPLFIANWKMNKTAREAKLFFQEFNSKFAKKPELEVVICPPFTLLDLAVSASESKYAIGAQNVFWEPQGAFTGEISAAMIKDLGCSHVIVGHSERRQWFGETNQSVNLKVKVCMAAGLVPVVCVGETLLEMEAGKAGQVVEEQVREGLEGVSVADGRDLVMAYEPVWAIGTGKADTPEQSNQTIQTIRGVLNKLFGEEVSAAARILYGGSVKPQNIRAFMSMPEIDGALVGGASLDPASFLQILLEKG